MTRLRDLDRRVFREERLKDPAVYSRVVSRWWLWYAIGSVMCLAGVLVVALTPEGLAHALALGAAAAAPGVLFRAGGLKVEHDRLHGRNVVLGMRRPAGL